MPSPSPVPQPDAVRQVLEHIRQAEPLDARLLGQMAWAHQAAAESAHLPLELSAAQALLRLIETGLARLRQVEGRSLDPEENRSAAQAALAHDFQQNSGELEAWSALYYRYVRVDLGWQAQELAALAGCDPRQLRRRLEHGLRRLAEALAHQEADARRRHQRTWLHHWLPPPTFAPLIGRAQEQTALHHLLSHPEPPAVVLVSGPGGVGKTALIREAAAHLIEAGQVDDLLWLALDAPTAYPDLLARLAGLAGFSPAQPSTEALSGLLRLRFQQGRWLLIVDQAENLEDPAHAIRHLNDLIGRGRALLAGRAAAPDAPLYHLPLGPLSEAAFADLLRTAARQKRVPGAAALDDETCWHIYQRAGGSPLAAVLIAGRMAALPLSQILDELEDFGGQADLLSRLFAEAWLSLPEAAQIAGLALYMLPPGATWPEAAALAGLPPAALNQALIALQTATLISLGEDGKRYTLAPLARQFIAGQLAAEPLRGAYQHMLSRQAAQAAARPQAADHLLGLLLAADAPQPADPAALLRDLSPVARRLARWEAWRQACEALLPSVGSSAQTAAIHLEIGNALRHLGHLEQAAAALEQAQISAGAAGDFPTQAQAAITAGDVLRLQGGYAQAYEAYQRAAATAERFAQPDLRRQALRGLADLALHQSRYEEAADLCQQALATFEGAAPDGLTLNAYAGALLHLNLPGQAAAAAGEALAHFEAEGDLYGQANALLRLGMIAFAQQQLEETSAYLQEALDILHTTSDLPGQARALTNLGALRAQQGQPAEAFQAWEEALTLQQNLGDRLGAAYTLYNLADLAWQQGDHQKAARAMHLAGRLAHELGAAALERSVRAHPLNG